jgi:diguanylate cyclase (GGDEF)-like protein/PAS domain S-box-containing protein
MFTSAASTLSTLFLCGFVIALALCAYGAAKRKKVPGAGIFALLMAGIAVYCFGSVFEVSAGTLERIVFWVRVEYLGIATIPAFWLILAFQYSSGGRRMNRWLVAALLAVAFATIVLNVTNDHHHLHYTWTALATSGPFPRVVNGHGPWFYVLVAYQYACMAAGVGLFFHAWLRSAPSARPQAAILIIGSLLPAVGDVLYLMGLTPYGVDITPLAMTATGLMCAFSIFRYHFLDVVPVALDMVFRTLQDGVLILDVNGKVVELNERARAVLGGKGRLRVGSTLREGLADLPDLARRLEEDEPGAEETPIDVDGETRRFDIRVSPVRDRRGRPLGRTIVLVDTTDRARLLEEMRRLAVTDDLTGLPNRRCFLERARIEMERASRTAKPVSAIAIDLDHFKVVNDEHGHAAGDAVLKGAAAAWRESLRSFDVLGRCGGEEFSVILPETGLETAASVAERMRAATESLAIPSDGGSIRFTASFGVACSTGEGDTDLDALLCTADRALYAAKEAGRNKVSRAP